MIGFLYGDYDDETFFKDEFKSYALRGEWFAVSPYIVQTIESTFDQQPRKDDVLFRGVLKSLKFHKSVLPLPVFTDG